MAVATPPVSAPAVTRRARRRLPRNPGTLIVLGIVAVLTLGPVVWTLVEALTPQQTGSQATHVGFSAFRDVFDQVDMGMLVLNSALVTGLIVLGQMFSAALAGYVFARLEFRGRGLLFGLVLATMMVPLQVTIVPVFMLIRGIGLADTLLALILPAIPTAFGTFL